MASGEQIQSALRAFVTRWADYAGSERSEAQTFLNELFACYGSDRQAVGAKFEDFRSSAGFMDLHWPGICIVEMKAPNRDLAVAHHQVERYWRESSDPDSDARAARWVVLCSFQRFEIWEPGRFPSRARASFGLEELPDKYDVLGFLAGPNVEPVFTEHHRELTKDAAKIVAKAFHSLKDRSAAPPDELQRFVLQSVWCMFAEDLGMLDGYPFQSTLTELIVQPERSAADIGFLFRVLNQKSNHNRKGKLAGTRYVNGELFAQPAEVELNQDEVILMVRAANFDWRKVDPTIFGSLLEGVLGRDRRWELGAHYTHEVDIMKIVTPTIIRPWRERIEATTSPTQGRELLDELCAFRVLDPACGCGNFLYVAYRELRGLEHELKERIVSLARDKGHSVPPGPWPYFPLSNMQGIDIERSAVLIARVTLWMGHRQMIERYGEAEDPLPLVDLSSVRVADALRVPWPETECIIGNPPFLGSQFIRRSFGDEYVTWLQREFGVGVKDFCTYWFRRAADQLKPGQRAGLVGTNSISQNRARSVSLQYVIEQGGVITDAVTTQKWPGDAKVHVSLVNWIDEPDEPIEFLLDGVSVSGISASLTDALGDAWKPARLNLNKDRCFQGPIPVGNGFIIASEEASMMLSHPDRGLDYSDVVRPYLVGDDIAKAPDQAPSRWIIDFGHRALEDAQNFPVAIALVRDRVKPERETNRDRRFREEWWRFGRPRHEMRTATQRLSRYVTSNRVGKRLLVTWTDVSVCPSDLTMVFAFEDDYAMGILLSRAHDAWAWAQASTLETRLRYTPTSVFETFAWPDPVSDVQRERVAEASRRLLARRTEICAAEQIGLTKLYNAVDEGAWADLKALHKELDEAVADLYCWPKAAAQDDKELVRRLTELNREIVEGGRAYAPFE
ncbi:MAG TPA: DNA methyltransferase [Nocardioidaceae bacterium]|nr:DNA methyltransferase [Nocardioidaceae bacterium]